MTSPFATQSFSISHADSGTFKGAGLRPFFEYRDLGIKHRERRHSDDMELIEIISPADFPTHEEDAP